MIRFEWRYQTRQASFLLALAFFLLMGLVLVKTGYGPDNVHINSPYVITQSLGFLSLLSIFMLTVFCASAVLRDTEHRMAELVYATAVTKHGYLLSRFAGILLAGLAVFGATTLVLAAAPWVLKVDPARLGSPQVAGYLWALGAVALPNLVFAASLLFAISALTRSVLATYIGGVFAHALYFISALLTNSPLMAGAAPTTPDALARAALADPFGLSAFFEQTRYWTEPERNTRLLSLTGHFLTNRLLWLGVSAALLGLVYARFAFRVAPGTKTGRDTADEPPATGLPTLWSLVAPRPATVQAHARALRSALKVEARQVLLGRPFLAFLALWVFMVGMELSAGGGGEYGTRTWPTTGLLLERLQTPLSLIGTIALIYYAAERVWRERALRLDALLDATPAPSAVFYLSKALVLLLLVGALSLSAMGVGVLYQLLRGYQDVQPGLYLSLLYFTGLPLALFAVAALFLQTLSPNRYVGMLLCLPLALVIHRGEAVGLGHDLLRYAGAPGAPHTDLNGFALASGSFTAFMLYWSAFAGLLALVTVALWRRGEPGGPRARLAALPRFGGRGTRQAAATCLGVFLGMGILLYVHTTRLNRYETAEQLADWKADYEKSYKRLEEVPQPDIVAVKTRVDLYPEEHRYRVVGTYRLENRTATPIDSVWTTVRRDVSNVELTLANARRTELDTRFGVSRFQLERPLPPGEQAELSFTVDVARRGFRTGPHDASIVDNGTFILDEQCVPTVGYRATYELGDEGERRARGLPPATTLAPRDAWDPTKPSRHARAWKTFETTVSTSADQLAVAPGVLEKEWREGDRRYFHYALHRPMAATPVAYASARYAVEKRVHRGIDVEVLYHPEHGRNVQRMLDAATRSLDVFSELFGPYPHEQLRLVEVPSYWSFGALALPGTLFFVEDRSFLTDARDPDDLDLVTRRVAHEVAHQWWGHQLDPAEVAGGTTLNESLAKDSELLVTRALHGEAVLPALRAFERDRYLAGRASANAPEPPLAEATDEAWLYYGKGALVMAALRDLLGDDAMNHALRRLLREHGWPRSAPTTKDLRGTLRAEASEAQRTLVDQWLEEVVLYDLRVESVEVQALAGGRHRVTARIAASKTARRGGVEVPLDLDEDIDIAVYDGPPEDGAAVLHLGKHRLQGPETEVSVVVDARPAYVGVDPRLLRIERERSDNVRKILSFQDVATASATPRPTQHEGGWGR